MIYRKCGDALPLQHLGYHRQGSESLLPTKQRDDSIKCLDDLHLALLSHKIHIPKPNDTCDPVVNEMVEVNERSDKTRRIYIRECELMGLTWLLAKKKIVYTPTISAVSHALMYNGLPPHVTTCNADQQKIPLHVDSSQLDKFATSYNRPKEAFFFVALPPRPSHYCALLHSVGHGSK
ncbi:hypothetical protein KI387_042789, partial [Taxus chinensis]